VDFPRPQTVPGPASRGGCVPHAQGVWGSRWASMGHVDRVAAMRWGRGTVPTVFRLRPCVAGMPRGQPWQRCATPPGVSLACTGGRAVRVRRGGVQAGIPWDQSGRGRPGGGGAAGPNKAVEPTAPMGALWHVGAIHGAAAHCGRSAARISAIHETKRSKPWHHKTDAFPSTM